MVIYIGADHGGFPLKESLKKSLHAMGYEVVDVGAATLIPDDDYPDYAKLVAENVAKAAGAALGVLICRSGVGVDIVANKFRGVRSVLAQSPDHAYQARHDDDVNVLSLASDFTDEAFAEKILRIFLSTPFAPDERYARRLRKIGAVEDGEIGK